MGYFRKDNENSEKDFPIRRQEYYLPVHGAEDAKYMNFNEYEEEQRKDKDVKELLYNGLIRYISEKVRYRDYQGDTLFELWSCLERYTPGWAFTSEADILDNFYQNNVVTELPINQVVDFVKSLTSDFLEEIKKKSLEMLNVAIRTNKTQFQKINNVFSISVAKTNRNNSEIALYHTASLIVDNTYLKANGVDVKIFRKINGIYRLCNE